LQRIFEAEAGRSLSYFFQQWYAGQGYPTFSVRWNQVGPSLYLQTTETASVPTATPFFDTDLDYKISFADGTSQVVRLRQSQALSSFSVPAAGTVSAIELDPDQWVLNEVGTIQRDNGLVLANKNLARAAQLHVYPNPCHDFLQLADLGLGRVITTVEVIDAAGHQVLRQALRPEQTQLDTRSLASGLYLLRFTTAKGEVMRGRFVRE